MSLLLLAALIFSSPGCERARGFVENFGKKETSATGSTVPLVKDLAEGEMDSFARQRGRVVIVVYQASWSGPSRQLDPFFPILAAEFGGKLLVGKVDIERFRDLAKSEGVKEVPEVRIYRDGRFVEKFVGLRDEDEIRGKIAKLAKNLSAPQTPALNAAGKPIAEPMRKGWMPEGVRRR